MGDELVPFTDLLSKIVDNRGRTCPTSDRGWPLIATNCIRNDLLYPAYEKVRYVAEETYRTWFRGHPEPGDLIFVCKGSPGRVCLAPDPVDFCIAQDMVAVRADPKRINPRYLFAILRHPETQRRIENMHVGTLIPHFKKGDFDKLMLPVPTRRIQEFVGDLYFHLSAKIELNCRMNRTLEGMARALFQSWFVDFDPVRAKAAGQRPPGLNAAIAKCFPAEFESNEAGRMPKGWKMSTLGDQVDLQRGKTYKSSLKDLPGPVLLGLGSINRNGGFRGEKLSTYGGDSPANLILTPGDLYVSLKDVTQSADLLGAVARVPASVIQGRLTQDTVKLIFKDQAMSKHIVYRTLLTQEYRDYCRSHATGTTNLGLSRDDFLAYPICNPPAPVKAAFDSLLDSIEGRSSLNSSNSDTLAALRDALLPKLISGELRIPDAKRIVEAHCKSAIR